MSAASSQGLPEPSLWKNEKGSLLLIAKVDTTKNTFSGTYVDYDKVHAACVGVPVEINGTVSGNNVSIVGNFERCAQTITIWKGTLSGTTLSATFDVRYVDKNYTFKEDKGSDVYTKQY